MKKIACAEMGIKGCSFVATGQTDDEVKRKLNEHGMSAHGDMMKGMKPADMKKMSDRMDQLLKKQK